MKPYFETERGQLINGDCLEVMRGLPDKSVQCGVTSPPYFGLRDYGESGQLGLEPTPEEYVEKLVAIFNEFKRVLRDDGTLWLNLGDSYASSGIQNPGGHKGLSAAKERYDGIPRNEKNDTRMNGSLGKVRRFLPAELKAKNLIGIPWRVAFALQADGWYLRQDIIWHKPNPMPESVTDRCTKAHEYIFLLSKSPKYYFDNKAIKEPSTEYKRLLSGPVKFGGNNRCKDTRLQSRKEWKPTMGGGGTSFKGRKGNFKANGDLFTKPMRNKRSVWTVTTKPFKEAHFATFPPDLILPCILAGCPEGGVVMDMFSGAGTVDRKSVV